MLVVEFKRRRRVKYAAMDCDRPDADYRPEFQSDCFVKSF